MLAGKPIIAGSVTQLIKLWRDELDVYEDDGAIKVATRDGRTVFFSRIDSSTNELILVDNFR